MPLSFRQAGNLFIAGPNINIYPSGNTFAISGSASGGGGGSGTAVTGLTSAGTGNILVLSSITNNNTVLVQKSLSAGTGVAIIDDGNGTLTFSATSAGGIISGTNVGTGTAVFSGVVGTNMVFRTLRGGLNASVFLSGTNIVISATTGTINGITALTNVGGGIAVASSVTNNTLISRTLFGTNGLDVVESGNLVVVRPSSALTANRFVIAGTGGALTTSDFYQTDSTVGTMSLGFTTPELNVTSRLLIAAGTSAVSQIRLTPFAAAYTTATNGDIWYNTTSGNSLFFNKGTSAPTPFIFKDNNFSLSSFTPVSVTNTSALRVLEADITGTLLAGRFLNTLGVFTTITSKTISNTTVETSVLSTGGTFLYGDNLLNSASHTTNPHLVVGKKYRFNAKGIISGTSGGDFYGKMLIGSSLIASSSTFSLNTSLNNNYFEIDTTFTILDVGTNGRVIGSGKMLTDASSLVSGVTRPIVAVSALGGLTGVTVNTSSDQFFDFTIDFSTASTTNAVTITEATLEYLN